MNLNFKNVLCLLPHPDDIEISMSGTILKSPIDVIYNIFYLSYGTKWDDTTSKERFNECEKFWDKKYNVNKMHEPGSFIPEINEDEWIYLIEKTYDLNDIDAIFIPAEFDTHFEHRIVNSIGRALARNKKISLIEYKSGSATDEWIPNLFIDVSDIIEEKLKRLKCFESQKKNYLDDDYLFVFHEHLQSRRKGISYVEQFKIIQLYE